ncbi:sensor histidine kinase [Polaribacter marinus]|uniref:tetratricopeptide repeat-containing sensor histidine kinase n=1 Tax=Polaribacter marinus TaxID=2916838 RepID=UPI001F5631D1|nr:sensor histidine kinase [Polaribacter marinus]
MSKNNEPFFLKTIDHFSNALSISVLTSFKLNSSTVKYSNTEFKKDKNTFLRTLPIICFNQNQQTPEKLNKVKQHKDDATNTSLLAEIYKKNADKSYRKNDFEEAIKNYTLAIENYRTKKKDSLHKADAIYFRGQSYNNIGSFLKSIDDCTLAIAYYKNLGDLKYEYFAKTTITKVYSKIGLNEKAIEELLIIIDEKEANNYSIGLASNYYNLAINYKTINEKEKYKEYIFKALKVKQSRNDDDGFLPYYQSAIAEYYLEEDSLHKAKEFLDLAKKGYASMLHNNFSLHKYQKTKSTYFFKTKAFNKALDLAKTTIAHLKKHPDLSSTEELYKLIYEIYYRKDDTKNALYYFKSYIKTKDSISNISKISALNYYQTLLNVEQKEKKINQQKSSIEILAKKNQAKKELLIIISSASFLSFLIFYLYWNKLHLKKQKKIQEDFSHKLLLSQEDERKRISKDLHDGLGQSLLIIKNRIAALNDKETEELICNSIEEIRRISKSLHPFQLESVGLTSALHNLLHQLDNNCDTYIFGNIENIDSILSPEKEVNIYRIIQESLSNIIKHAKAKSARVNIDLSKNHISILIIDNGIGFDFDEKYHNIKSFGLKTINERVKFLNGTLKIHSIKNEGTTLNILLPLK